MSKNLKKFYFTFGDDRLDKYVLIHAENELSARKIMFYECGRQWCTSYPEKLFLEMTKDRNMKKLFEFWEE